MESTPIRQGVALVDRNELLVLVERLKPSRSKDGPSRAIITLGIIVGFSTLHQNSSSFRSTRATLWMGRYSIDRDASAFDRLIIGHESQHRSLLHPGRY